jgi:hypothetical protein
LRVMERLDWVAGVLVHVEPAPGAEKGAGVQGPGSGAAASRP